MDLQVPVRLWFGPKYWATYAESRRALLAHIHLQKADAEKHDSVLRRERSFLEMHLMEWVLRDFYFEEKVLRVELDCALGLLQNRITEPPDRHLIKSVPLQHLVAAGYDVAKLAKPKELQGEDDGTGEFFDAGDSKRDSSLRSSLRLSQT